MTMTFEEFRAEFERRALASRLWHHPWFFALSAKPALSHLRHWAIAAGAIDEVFVNLLTALRDNPGVPKSAHAAISANIADEEGNGEPSREHFALFRRVLGVLGVSDRAYEYHRSLPLPGTDALVRALAMMASEEFICPREFPILMRALSELNPEAAKEWEPYFVVHCECDPGHASDLIRELYSAVAGDSAKIARAFACQAEDLALNAAFYDSLVVQCYLYG